MVTIKTRLEVIRTPSGETTATPLLCYGKLAVLIPPRSHPSISSLRFEDLSHPGGEKIGGLFVSVENVEFIVPVQAPKLAGPFSMC